MKYLSLLTVALLFILLGCEKDSDSTFYKNMKFDRLGGGQITFNILPTGSSDKVSVEVTRYNFMDTTIRFSMDNATISTNLFLDFYDAVNNKLELEGDFQQTDFESGTWAYIYFENSTDEVEVTNTEIRTSLLYFEGMVLSHIAN